MRLITRLLLGGAVAAGAFTVSPASATCTVPPRLFCGYCYVNPDYAPGEQLVICNT
jgi:hypothetical protein